MYWIVFALFQDSNTNWQHIPSLPLSSKIQLQDHENQYWLTAESGIFKVGKTFAKLNENLGITAKQIIAIEQFNNVVFLDTTDGLFQLAGNRLTKIPVSGKGNWDLPVETLFFQLGFNHPGPFAFDGKHLWSLHLPNNKHTKVFLKDYPNASFNPRGIYCIYKDPKKGYWFGTSASGMYYYNGIEFSWIYEKDQIQTPQGGDFAYRSIVVDHSNHIWINSWKYYITWENIKEPYEKHSGQIQIDPQPYFLAMEIDQKGNIWGMTFDNGIYRKSEKAIDHFPIQANSGSITLTGIWLNHEGEVFVSSNKGIYQFMNNSFQLSPLFKP